jgi:hypothetical protein
MNVCIKDECFAKMMINSSRNQWNEMLPQLGHSLEHFSTCTIVGVSAVYIFDLGNTIIIN